MAAESSNQIIPAPEVSILEFLCRLYPCPLWDRLAFQRGERQRGWVGSSGDMELISCARAIKERAFSWREEPRDRSWLGERRRLQPTSEPAFLDGRTPNTRSSLDKDSSSAPCPRRDWWPRTPRCSRNPQAVLPGEQLTHMKIGHVRRFPRLRVDMDSRGRQKSP